MGGRYLDGAGLAPVGQCSENVVELGNAYMHLITSFSLLEYA